MSATKMQRGPSYDQAPAERSANDERAVPSRPGLSETDRSQAVDIRRSGRRTTGTNVYVALCQALGRAIRPTPSTGSATDAVAQVCGLRRVDHPNDLQLNARLQHLKLPTATPEQHRDLMNYQLVQHTGLKRPLRRVRAMHQHVPVPGRSLGLCLALAIPSVTYVTNG